MVDHEKYKKHIFFTAFVLAVVVFISGIVVGYILDSLRVNDVMELIKQNELNIESYIVEQQFIDYVAGDSCKLLEPRFKGLSENLAEIGTTLTIYEKSKLFKKSDYGFLKRKYFNLEVQTSLLLMRLKKECDIDKIGILYFYKQDDSASLRQGYILDALVEEYGIETISIYSFDKYFEDTPLVDMVEQHYNITTTPSLIINNEFKISGLIEKDKLKEIIFS